MGAIPGSIETDAQPPMSVPLQHFVIGLGFLLAAGLLGVLAPLGILPGRPTLAYVHVLLAGWVCLTIMGAMTQFVPVWSGRRLYSERLAAVQLPPAGVGVAGLAGSFLLGTESLLPLFGALALAGFWLFVYILSRTLAAARPWDVTERHFAFGLGFLALATLLGLTLASTYVAPVLSGVPITRGALRAAHATLAVFGGVLTVVLGALYQLATMFTQSERHGLDRYLRRIEELGYPAGVLLLATARLFDHRALGRLGALLVLLGLSAFAIVLARRLSESTVAWTPTLQRYAVVVAALLAWAGGTAPAWYADPTTPASLFGPPRVEHLLLVGVVGVVVLGTLYHVVPFIVWVHRYSDRLGIDDVPMIDDLYDDRLATVDLLAVVAGIAALTLAAWFDLSRTVALTGGVLVAAGFAVFATNASLVVRRHSPRSVVAILLHPGARRRESVPSDHGQDAGD